MAEQLDKNEITFFARTNFRNREVPFGIKLDDRRRHMYVIGKTGMGKTTLMENMAIQDINNGHGVCFIDPHGDSITKILDFVPNSRVNDVIYFNPADLDHPIGFNILEAVETRHKHLVASGLMGVFTKIWANMWSARMEYILNNTILALLESPGNTMLGIARMYIDKKYRKKIIDSTKDPMVRAFWIDEFANYNEKYRTEAVAPIQNKVGQFLSSAIIRNIVGQPKSTIDLRGIMDGQKILLIDLSKGKVGEDNAALLGAMIITKLQLAALSRVDIPEHERRDFFLYVDEFQNFVTDSFATILSEARKYRLNLTIGHQYIGQLTPDPGNNRVRDAVFGNVGTMVCFRVGAADAEFLETEFEPVYTPNDIVNLPKYNIILKLMINGVTSNPFTATTMQINEKYRTGNQFKVIKVSQERYGNSVAEVEEKITRWMGAEFHEQSALVIGGETGEERPAPNRRSVEAPLLERIAKPVEPRVVAAAPVAAEPATERVVQEVERPAPAPKPAQKLESEFKPRVTTIQQSPTRSEPREQRPAGPPQRRQEQPRGFHAQRPQRKHTQPQGALKKSSKPVKRDNPIWDTVATLQTEKIEQVFSKPTPTGAAPRAEPSTQPGKDGGVLQPGQVHKF